MKTSSISSKYKKVLFLVDHKHRDLPSLALIGYYLHQMKYEVKYVALWQEDDLIESFDPGYIIIPKPIYDIRRLIRLKVSNRYIIIINPEGALCGDFKMNLQLNPDLFLFWNEHEYQKYKNLSSKNGKMLCKVVGSPRIDFFHKRFVQLYPSREDLLKKYNLSPNKKTITFATSCVPAQFRTDQIKQMASFLKQRTENYGNYEDTIINSRVINELTEKMISDLVNRFPQINIIVKPHPNENIFYWENLLNSLPSRNTALFLGESINNLLQVSDLHVSHHGCSTTFESLLSGILSVEIHTDESKNIVHNIRRLELPNYIVKTIQELTNIVEKYLINGEADIKNIKTNSILSTYTADNFYKFDGLRCEAHANEISNFIKNTYNRNAHYGNFLLHYPKFIPHFLNDRLRHLKNKILSAKKYKWSFGSKDSNSNGIKIDSRGRYDIRIKPGDEEYWFNKFGQLRLSTSYLKNKNRTYVHNA